MKDYIVTFEVEGEIHSLEFTDKLENPATREINAKMWINDYIQQVYNGQRKIYRIINIQPA